MTDEAADESVRVTLESLPDELLIRIFKWLPIKQIVDAVGRVCTRWRKVSRDPLMWHRVNLQIDDTGVSADAGDYELDVLPWEHCTDLNCLPTEILKTAPCLNALMLNCAEWDSDILARTLSVAPCDIRCVVATGCLTNFPVLLKLLAKIKDHVIVLKVVGRADLEDESPDLPPGEVYRFWQIVASSRRLASLAVQLPDLFLQELPSYKFLEATGGLSRLRFLLCTPRELCTSPSGMAVKRNGRLSGNLARVISAYSPGLRAVALPWISCSSVREEVYFAVRQCPLLEILGVPYQRDAITCVENLLQLKSLFFFATACDEYHTIRKMARMLDMSVAAGRIEKVAFSGLRRLHLPLFLALSNMPKLKSLRIDSCDFHMLKVVDVFNSLKALRHLSFAGMDISYVMRVMFAISPQTLPNLTTIHVEKTMFGSVALACQTRDRLSTVFPNVHLSGFHCAAWVCGEK